MTKIHMQVGALLFIFEGEEAMAKEALAEFRTTVSEVAKAQENNAQTVLAAAALAKDRAAGH